MSVAQVSADGTATADYALYRHFDCQEKLLYIGLTNDPERREPDHRSQSFWMELTVRSEVESYDSLPKVRAAERDAILAEQPLFNRQHNESPEAHARLRAYLIRIRRLDLLPADLTTWIFGTLTKSLILAGRSFVDGEQLLGQELRTRDRQG